MVAPIEFGQFVDFEKDSGLRISRGREEEIQWGLGGFK